MIKVNFPSTYIARNGEKFTLLGPDSKGRIIGARNFAFFDPATLNAVEPKDENLDLISWDDAERKEQCK